MGLALANAEQEPDVAIPETSAVSTNPTPDENLESMQNCEENLVLHMPPLTTAQRRKQERRSRKLERKQRERQAELVLAGQ